MMNQQDLDNLAELLERFRKTYTVPARSKWEHYDTSVAVVTNIVTSVRDYGHTIPGSAGSEGREAEAIRLATSSQQAKTQRPFRNIQAGRWEIP